MQVGLIDKTNQTAPNGMFTPEADPNTPWFVPVSTPTGFSPQYSLNWDIAKGMNLDAITNPFNSPTVAGPANDPGWDAYTKARRESLGLPVTGTISAPASLPSVPSGITMGTPAPSSSPAKSMDVWDYLKNFEAPSTFEPPSTDAPKVGWGI